MKIESYNSNRYIHVTDNPRVDYWWDNTLQQIAAKKTIQQLILIKDSVVLQCATMCIGQPINCCPDSLLSNNLDCLFANDFECLVGN
jgi:hypothetical protein